MDAWVADATALGAANAVERLRLGRVPVPKPAKGQVLVKMACAPCNPADFLYLEGRYGIDRPLPATPGFEGAGTVVASGGGMLGGWLMGKRVACGGHECSGTWAQYTLTAANQCLPLDDALSFEQGATALTNPITALVLVELIKSGGHRAYVQSAAAGQLGQMIHTIGAEQGLTGIHVVRKAAQAEVLQKLGAAHVLDSTAPDFPAALAAKARELHATIALDAVAGELTGVLLNAMPHGAQVVIYGALSGLASGGIDPMALAFGAKVLRGFEVATVLKNMGMLRSVMLARKAQARVVRGLTSTVVRSRVPLAQAKPALLEYARSMSEGKVLMLAEG
jgi:NADPH:quinone reductase